MAVFGTENNGTLAVRAGRAIIDIEGSTVLALNVQIQYQRQVGIVPALGEKRIVSIGEPEGTISIEKVIGDDVINKLFEDNCTPFSITLRNMEGCTGQESVITCTGCVFSATTITAQGGRGYVAHGVTATFTQLDM